MLVLVLEICCFVVGVCLGEVVCVLDLAGFLYSL